MGKLIEAKGYKAFRGTMRIKWDGEPPEEIYGDWIFTKNGPLGFWHHEELSYPASVCEVVEVGGHWEPDPYHPGYVRCGVCKKSIVSVELLEAEEIRYCQYCGTELLKEGE